MEFIREHQLIFMMFMSGICGILAFTSLITQSLSRRRKSILALMALSTMFLLLFDRASYIYRGNVTELGFIMVRVCNGMVYFLSCLIPQLVTRYLKDLYQNEGGLSRVPILLTICEWLFAAGVILIVISQFTGLYYTFDEQNIYQRSPANFLCFVFPLLILLLQEITIIRNWNRLRHGLIIAIAICISLPIISSVIQYFNYGISLTNITTVFVVVVFYVYALFVLNRTAEDAKLKEIEFYKQAQQREAALFEQTAEALANAIDAKDKYTRGHSSRVADISLKIAKEYGLSEADCKQVYFSALLHDVGKIGIRNDIINKDGKLTDEEFEQIKLHPLLGDQILSSIKQSPSLRVGAHYHHERYDGTGYPDGLSGEDIPEIARIIAVADAYDAMTSNRSYRASLPQQEVRQELIQGAGKQFDPKFAEILLRILDSDC